MFYKDVEANQFVIPGSNYHMRIGAPARLKSMFDDGDLDRHRACPRCRSIRSSSATSAATPTASRTRAPRPACNDAIKLGFGKLDGLPVVIARAGFRLHGRLARHGGRRGGDHRAARPRSSSGTPFIMFAASGGARMQEGILSLMQLPRTTVAVQMLREAKQALHRRADQSDHRRRHRLLRHARRRAHRRARRADRLCRPARDRADHPREAARRLPARRISAPSTAWSTWSCTATSCARRSPNCAGC